MKIAPWMLAFATAACAAVDEPNPAEVLRRVTAKALDSAHHLPNYTCVETVTRRYFRPTAPAVPRACAVLLAGRNHRTPDLVLRPFAIDRLRLDVTMVERGEIFSWAGAARFDDAGIEHLVRYGPMGSGAFGGFLIAVFQVDPGRIAYVGRSSDGARNLMEYSFSVAASASHYKVKMGEAWYITAYSGAFLVDPDSDDIVQMTVRTGDLPAATESCQSIATLDYSRVEIGSSQFLLPARMRQTFVSPTGYEAENTAEFTGCREYKGESTVTFFADPESVPGTSARISPSGHSALSAGLGFSMELISVIATDSAAAGDAFTGRLTAPLRDPKSKITAPKGALVEGRLLRVQSFFSPPSVFVVIRPRTVEVKGLKVALAAVRDWPRKKGTRILLPGEGEERSGIFEFAGEHVVVPAGFRSDWRTVTVPAPEPVGSR